MAIIPNFPQHLLNQHHSWHVPGSHLGIPGRSIPQGFPGSGIEFLTFHRDFGVQFHAWYDGQPFADPAAVAPWQFIPTELKQLTSPPHDPGIAWNANRASQETRIITNVPSFATEDEFGIFVETTIHNWIHGATATAFNEPAVAGFHSPESTYFYQIHGLVDYWWSLRKSRVRDAIVTPPVDFKDVPDGHKSRIKDQIDTPPVGVKQVIDGQKSRIKDVVDNPPVEERGWPPVFGDDLAVSQLMQRISVLETFVAGNAFIRPEERPEVGGDALHDGEHGQDGEDPEGEGKGPQGARRRSR